MNRGRRRATPATLLAHPHDATVAARPVSITTTAARGPLSPAAAVRRVPFDHLGVVVEEHQPGAERVVQVGTLGRPLGVDGARARCSDAQAG
jgi:hypothetical protein